MATPKLAYCAEAGRITEGVNAFGDAQRSLSAETIRTFTRRGRRLRAEAFAELISGLSRHASAPFSAVRGHLSKRKAIRDLRALSDHMLRDIGIGRSDIPAVVEGLQSPERLPNEYRRVAAAKPKAPRAERTLDEAA